MTRLIDAARGMKAPRLYFVVALAFALLLAAIAIPELKRSRRAAELPRQMEQQGAFEDGRAYAPAPLKSAAFVEKQRIVDSQAAASNDGPDAEGGRKIVRNASIAMTVQHPAEVADRITTLAEKLGGYLVCAGGGGEDATPATVTIRVPVAHFEEARAEIRKLGLRIESDTFEARDVTQQYIDQDATIRNLQAEELQYLEILKQANNVNSMLLVADKLSEVRGKIEKQQAEFNSLSHQAETVAIAVSLGTEGEQQVFGIHWRPLYELKVAASNGLESLATYATTMMTILFYLPAVLLWVGTILGTAMFGGRAVHWVRRWWLGWRAAENPIQ